ncbi:Uncharacterized OsmC-related protein [Salinihabitans flavidus]|uniref:Uncharacterized OsmC-related protein n=1 Tax=Salinihabitans flavidus TaxID=569882 RepID=A0A1H8W8T4_9RHOB|nr:OsmC family protein [Salinihabitans flavidus]SEP24064.1 Uncharacterized OsmC-related protein [Salinihabitans flavidus]
MSKTMTALVKERQEPLQDRYKTAPDEARITDHAIAESGAADPFHGTVKVGDGQSAPWDFGIHRAIGGDHDLPNPGDILCAALAACLDSTLCMIAARMGVPLESLEVSVNARVDVRGCLMVDRTVPTGFQRIEVDVLLEVTEGVEPAQIKMLTSTAEQCCVVLQTLREGVPVTTTFREPTEKTAAE